MKKHHRDIPDLPILQFLELIEAGKITAVHAMGGKLSVWQPKSGTAFEDCPNSLLYAIPHGRDYPKKLRVTKIYSMVRRGLIDGCTCGCRGDFQLTDKGRAILNQGEKM